MRPDRRRQAIRRGAALGVADPEPKPTKTSDDTAAEEATEVEQDSIGDCGRDNRLWMRTTLRTICDPMRERANLISDLGL